MQIFELHFNPKAKEDKIFDSFCYEPENVYEKRLGGLYMVGALNNALPQNSRFLDKIAQVMRGNYYSLPSQKPEQSLKECLKKANEFLSEEVSKENVSWLGNLSFAILSLVSRQKSWLEVNLNFTKVGEIKILLLRNGEITDIGKNLALEEIEPYPLKIFNNIVSGKLGSADKVLVLTKEIFEFLSAPLSVLPNGAKTKKGSGQNLLQVFSQEDFDDKKIRDRIKIKEKEFSEVSGICLLIDLSTALPSKQPKILTFQKELEEFSIKQALYPLTKIFKKSLNILIGKLKPIFIFFQFQRNRIGLKDRAKRKKQKSGERANRFWQQGIFRTETKKNLILVLTLTLFIIVGFYTFQNQEKQNLNSQKETLERVKGKIIQAENFLLFKDEEKANILLKEAWEEILPLTKKEDPLKDEAERAKDSIEKNLEDINRLEKITDPKLVFEFSSKEFIPEKMVIFRQNLYFFNSYSQNLFKLNQEYKGQFIQTNQNFNLAAISNNSILFFQKPDKAYLLKDDTIFQSFSLKLPSPDFNFSKFALHYSSIYFLDSEKGEIVKYPAPLEKNKDYPEIWLSAETKKAFGGKSMAIDGSVWILNENNTIWKYHTKQYKEEVVLDFFPYPQKIQKIFTSANLPYIYLSEPIQNRIIILDKTGKIIKQFQSEKFENLKDFAVSDNAKTIYVLSGVKIFQIDF